MVGLSSTGTVITPAANAPTATKLTCPNEITPEFPTNTYSADHDRHGDKRASELDLEIRVDETQAADDSDEHEQRDGAKELHEVISAPHTRSTADGLDHAKSPSGRTSRTRMTSMNTAESR